MGPEAGCWFYRKVIRSTPARCDQEHFRVILYSQPKIPDRTAFLQGRGESPIPHLNQAARDLEKWGADLIAIPCNTAHHFWEEIQAEVAVPVLHIVRETADMVARSHPQGSPCVGVLATHGTISGRLYQKTLQAKGIRSVVPKASPQEQVQESIEAIKGGGDLNKAASVIQAATEWLAEQGAQAVIFGCTELNVLDSLLRPPVPIYDSSEILAQATVRFALGR